jgi:hypothetical protein
MKTMNLTSRQETFNPKQITSTILAALATLLLLTGAAFAAPKETDPIWRVQLRIQTADVEDAGTDDNVRVALNLNNNTWLDYGRDDFPRNNTFTYDLKLDHVATIADLSHLYLAKTGSDGLCVKALELLVNGRLIYTETFPGYGHWLDNSGGHSNIYEVNYTQLRQDNSWQAYFQPLPPLVIDRPELESRIESIMGDFATGNRLQWGHRYGRAFVEATKGGALNTVHVDLDMELDVPGFNPEVDIDFDLQVLCASNQVQLKVLNPRVVVDSNWITEVLSYGLINLLDNYLSSEATKALRGINLSRNISVPSCPVINVVNVTVNGQTEVQIQFSLPPVISKPITALPTTISGFTAARVATGRTERAPEEVEDGDAPLTVAVETADSFPIYAETPYTLLVQTHRQAASEINVQITLPTGITASQSYLEVEDANGARTLPALFTTNEQGGLVLSFQDRLDAGAAACYRLPLRFSSLPQTELQLLTMVSAEAGVTLKSLTFFQLAEEMVRQRGTIQATKGMPTSESPSEKQ